MINIVKIIFIIFQFFLRLMWLATVDAKTKGRATPISLALVLMDFMVQFVINVSCVVDIF